MRRVGLAIVALTLAAASILGALDVSDPTTPMLLSIVDTGGSTRDVAIDGDWAFVADNNAGLVNQTRRETADGVEMVLAVNYLAYFQLSLGLLPLLQTAGLDDALDVTIAPGGQLVPATSPLGIGLLVSLLAAIATVVLLRRRGVAEAGSNATRNHGPLD